MDEIEIVQRIGQLVEDEHALERAHAGSPPSDEDVAQLRSIEAIYREEITADQLQQSSLSILLQAP